MSLPITAKERIVKSLLQTYVTKVSGAVGRLGVWEGRLLTAMIDLCSALVLLYSNIIFQTYPTCAKDAPCDYLVPVFIGDTVPPLE